MSHAYLIEIRIARPSYLDEIPLATPRFDVVWYGGIL
jgi:hypothetical protein